MGGLLHKLWDETLAGPAPDTGLDGLRNPNPLSAAPSSNRSVVGALSGAALVTRSITIVHTKNRLSYGGLVDSDQVPESPVGGSSNQGTPQSRKLGWWREWPSSSPEAFQQADAEPRSPTVYDWILISALDR